MSVNDVFEEELLSYLNRYGFGVSKEDIIRYEVSGNKLRGYLPNGLEVVIQDHRLVNLAIGKTNKELLASLLSKEQLLGRLYAFTRLNNEDLEPSEFERKYSSLSNSELLNKVEEYEKEFGEKIKSFKSYLIALIGGAAIRKSRSIPVGFDELLERRSTGELAVLYWILESSEGKREILNYL
jgi:hypothetical protein